MWKLVDSKKNIIVTAETGTTINFHNRNLINPHFYTDEWDEFIIFSNENLEKLINYYQGNTDEIIKMFYEYKEENQNHLDKCYKSCKEAIDVMNKLNKRVKQLERDNNDLKKLNIKLSQTIILLKQNKWNIKK